MRSAASTFVLGAILTAGIAAQSKPALTRADYGQWESLGGGTLSPDGAWIAYSINRSNRHNELRLTRLSDRTTKTVPFGLGATFSSDARWAAYSISYHEDEQERMRTARQPVQNKLGLINLTSGEMATIDGIQSFGFSGDGKYLAMRRYAPPAPGGASGSTGPGGSGPGGSTGATGAAGAAETVPVGVTTIVRDLATGRDTSFGNVGEYSWQDSDSGHLLALAISAEAQSGNGIHIYDPSTTVLRVLDSSAANYTSLAWREDSTDLALLRSRADDTKEGPAHVALAWRGVGSGSEKRLEFDPASHTSFPAGMRVVSFRRPSWSRDGRIVFVGIAKWEDRPPQARGRGAGGRGDATGPGRGDAGATGDQTTVQTTGEGQGRGGRGSGPPRDEPAAVDIWHWKDADVMARQKISASGDRRRNLLAAWHVDEGKFVQIGKSFTETVTPIERSSRALVREWTGYAMARSIGRPAADLYLADLATGGRTRLKDGIDDRFAQISPGGKYLLYLQDDHYWTIDLQSRATVNLTKGVPTAFIDRESDQTTPHRPPFGTAGWTSNDAGVLLYDRFDVWVVAPDGSKATRLTDGASEQVRHRIVRLDPDAEAVDLSQPVYFSLFGTWSKKSGYAKLMPPTTGSNGSSEDDDVRRAGRASTRQDAGRVSSGLDVVRLMFRDQSLTGLTKARRTDVFAYVAQRHDDSPDIFVATGAPGERDASITETNTFQRNFAWSRSEVIEYRTDKGRRLQGALYYPANYEAGKRYPMIVYLYERLSDGVHRYVAPSDRDYYNTTVFTSQGYLVLQPDIVFRPREPGLSVLECVAPAVKRVVDLGLADVKRVGVIGHSWGGFDTAFLATNTQGVFAAAVAGAAITNLVSNYGNHHWSSGIAETDHIETGQQRMEVPLYEDLPAYIRNSAVFNVHRMTTPLLLMTGDNDGTVYWHQAVELYNIGRRAQKNVVMLVYNGEDHGLRQKKNQIDYQQRILAWFGHYLKGDAAASWITQGQAFIEKR
jgi:dipeptidyl aminopeptidase/acylaminoacyl peptidase